jgi:hypothetical protein
MYIQHLEGRIVGSSECLLFTAKFQGGIYLGLGYEF